MLHRRTFLKAALWPIYLPLVKLAPPQQIEPLAAPVYTDSDNHDAPTLAPLHDGDRQAGGVEYQG